MKSALLVTIVALTVGAIPLIMGKVPPPSTHDEFSYLLAADTFLHGRLANPTPVLWRHFQTFHELMRPTYASKFPPGQGLALAVGTLLGHPIIGAFGSVALACAAITWMLRGWMPPAWALLGGLLAALHPLLFWWGEGYWGGGVAMLGGALLGGAAIRAVRRPRPIQGVIAGLGLALLANSRPFEGAITSVLLGIWVLTAAQRRGNLQTLLRRAVPGAVVVIIPAAGWMLYYNWRVTGHPLEAPYALYVRQYQMAPLLFGGRTRPPNPDWDPKLRHFIEGYEYHEYLRQTTPAGYLDGVKQKVVEIATRWVDPLTLLIPLAGLPLGLARSQKIRIATGVFLGLPLLHMALTPWMRMHYLAPAAGFFFAMLALSLRELNRWRFGKALVAVTVVGQAVAMATLLRGYLRIERFPGAARAEMVDRLETLPGKHLVGVRYLPGPQLIFEWVYNGADIDGSKVIFARYEDEAGLAELKGHYRDRAVWRLEVQETRYQLLPPSPPPP